MYSPAHVGENFLCHNARRTPRGVKMAKYCNSESGLIRCDIAHIACLHCWGSVSNTSSPLPCCHVLREQGSFATALKNAVIMVFAVRGIKQCADRPGAGQLRCICGVQTVAPSRHHDWVSRDCFEVVPWRGRGCDCLKNTSSTS